MKVTELMIGDWVLINDTPHKIQTINSIDLKVQVDSGLYYRNKIKSIPLTPEILEKNGWCLRPVIAASPDISVQWFYIDDVINIFLQFPTKQSAGLLGIFDGQIIRSLSNFI